MTSTLSLLRFVVVKFLAFILTFFTNLLFFIKPFVLCLTVYLAASSSFIYSPNGFFSSLTFSCSSFPLSPTSSYAFLSLHYRPTRLFYTHLFTFYSLDMLTTQIISFVYSLFMYKHPHIPLYKYTHTPNNLSTTPCASYTPYTHLRSFFWLTYSSSVLAR